MKYSYILISFLIFYGLTTYAQQQDHANLKDVYSHLVAVFQTEDDAALRAFCYELAPNEATLQYMRDNVLCYRGIPCQLDDEGMERTAIGNAFYSSLLRIRNRLKSEGYLENLKHIDDTEYKWDVEMVRGIPIPGTEMDVQLQSGNTIISYHMGEMISLNGRWSLFTKPSVDYYTREL